MSADVAILFDGEISVEQSGAELNGRVFGQLLGNESRGRHDAVVPLIAEWQIEPPILGTRLLDLAGGVFLFCVRIFFDFEIIGQQVKDGIDADCGLRVLELGVATLGLVEARVS